MGERKRLTLKECTKEELIAWLTSPRAFGAGEACLRFIEDRRFGMLSNSIDEAIEQSQVEIRKYIDYIKKANNESDLDKKIALLKEADRHYKLHEQYDRDYERLSKRQDEFLGLQRG